MKPPAKNMPKQLYIVDNPQGEDGDFAGDPKLSSTVSKTNEPTRVGIYKLVRVEYYIAQNCTRFRKVKAPNDK